MLQAFGMPNRGNTCYLNSMLQCIMSCPCVVQAVLAAAPRNQLVVALQQLLRHGTGHIDYMQPGPQDPHEALLLLLEKLDLDEVTRMFEHQYHVLYMNNTTIDTMIGFMHVRQSHSELVNGALRGETLVVAPRVLVTFQQAQVDQLLEKKYRLVATCEYSNHHYWALVQRDQGYHCNDSVVTPHPLQITGTSYICWYVAL